MASCQQTVTPKGISCGLDDIRRNRLLCLLSPGDGKWCPVSSESARSEDHLEQDIEAIYLFGDDI